MTTTKKLTKEDLGYNEGLKKLWFQSNSHLPNGNFVIQHRKGRPYWYYLLGSDGETQKGTKRLKYLGSSFEGTNDEGYTSFQVILGVLNEKFENNFVPTTRDSTSVGELIDEYIGVILREEGSDEGRKKDTTQGIINGCRRFKDYCLMEDIKFRDLKNPKTLKKIIIEYKDYCKVRRNPPLKRNTIRTYLKKVRGFLEWLSDEDVGRKNGGLIPVNPITSKFIQKIYPPTSKDREETGSRNLYYEYRHWGDMYNTCVHKVGELYRDFVKNGWSREYTNQPLGVGSKVVYFVSLFQIHSGFRVGEILHSYRNKEYWENRKDKKNSSTYWEKRGDNWFLFIKDFKGTSSMVPVNQTIRVWTNDGQPPNWVGEPTKVDKNGKPRWWDVQLVDVCLQMFRESPYLFSSPNYKSHPDRPYSMSYYGNIFRQILVSEGRNCEGWEGKGILTSHDLRDYFITYQIDEGMDMKELSLITRHSIQTLRKYYLRQSEKGQLERQSKMDKSRIVKSKSSIQKENEVVEIDTPPEVSLPIMITKSMKFDLYELGYSKDDISKMKVEDSWEIITQKIEK